MQRLCELLEPLLNGVLVRMLMMLQCQFYMITRFSI